MLFASIQVCFTQLEIKSPCSRQAPLWKKSLILTIKTTGILDQSSSIVCIFKIHVVNLTLQEGKFSWFVFIYDSLSEVLQYHPINFRKICKDRTTSDWHLQNCVFPVGFFFPLICTLLLFLLFLLFCHSKHECSSRNLFLWYCPSLGERAAGVCGSTRHCPAVGGSFQARQLPKPLSSNPDAPAGSLCFLCLLSWVAVTHPSPTLRL